MRSHFSSGQKTPPEPWLRASRFTGTYLKRTSLEVPAFVTHTQQALWQILTYEVEQRQGAECGNWGLQSQAPSATCKQSVPELFPSSGGR